MILCNNHDHARFQGVMFAQNGCLACTLEYEARRAAEFEKQLVQLADWCRARLKAEPNEFIGKLGWPCDLAGVITKLIDRMLEGRDEPGIG